MKNIDLDAWGLSKAISKELEEKYNGYYLGRVIEEHRNLYKIITEDGGIIGRVSGKMVYEANDRVDYPAVGDWVVLDRLGDENGIAIIKGVLTRKSKFSRKIAGKKSDEQIIASNIDTIFICMSLNHDFNLQRLERYTSLAWNSGAIPVVLLTKSDLCSDVDEKIQEVMEVSPGVDIYAVSSLNEVGIKDIEKYISFGKTVSFVGSSGVGKSTLINHFLGFEKQDIGEIRNDDRGKHTTTYRELMIAPSGGILIDTPGMREIHLLDDSDGVDSSFSDIEELADQCRFSNCSHTNEPGCVVRAAIEEGELSERRFDNYLKLRREVAFMERKLNKNAQLSYKKKIARQGRIRKDMFYRK
ncbi:ribosome small subunit-dependent GTPase A [Wukongibacter sp. M2B1]|uniref:ribosome small subunit-dependent GTPase A n=1 Tax=Wukongibacter sp. M2B1 TaxID=3088895 RepID=UPI003D79CA91